MSLHKDIKHDALSVSFHLPRMTVLQLGLLASLSCLAASRSIGQAADLPFSIEEEDAFRNSRGQEILEPEAPKDEDLQIGAQRYHL